MSGIFALRRKSGEGIMIRFVSEVTEGRSLATWTHYSPITESPLGHRPADRYGLGEAELK
jgi:hypothetical protein